MALWRFLREAADRYPHRVALTAGGVDCTYAELDGLVERVAAGLLFQGLVPGDRVVTVLGNTVGHLGLVLGCFRAGLVAVPMAPSVIPAQVRYALQTAEARAIAAPAATLATVFRGHAYLQPEVTIAVGDPDPARGVIPWEAVEAGPGESPAVPDSRIDHLGLILFTSGTTSRPKAVVHTQDRMAQRTAVFADEVRLTADDVAFVAHPVGRPLTLLGQVLGTFRAGGRVVLHDGGEAGFWAAYAAGPPKTFVIAIPGMVAGLLANPAATNGSITASCRCGWPAATPSRPTSRPASGTSPAGPWSRCAG